MKKKLNKKILFSLFSFPLVALPIGLATLSNLNDLTNLSIVSKSLNVNESTTDSSINLEDALPIADTSIKSFGDYIVSYEDNNVSPVNVIIPSLTTGATPSGTKAGGATVGMTANKQTITVTTYAGLLLWSHKLTENSLLKNYYSSVLTVSDISTYKVINFAYLESKNILFVLFGDEQTSGNTNLVIFGLDINSGAIIVPSEAKLSDNQVIAKARNNSSFIFFNTKNELIVTSGSTNTNIQNSTKIITFDTTTGFLNRKGNDETTNNFGTISGLPASNDYLLGFLPSSVEGINYSFWLYGPVSSSNYAKPQLSYKTSNDTTGASNVSINLTGGIATTSFNYYVFPVNDDFVNLTPSNNSGKKFDVANKKNDTTYRGYLNNVNSMPNFNSIFKRFFVTSSKTSGNTVTESVSVLLDSFDKMFTSFCSIPIILNSSNTSFTYGLGDTYFNLVNGQTTGPSAAGSLNYDQTKNSGLQDGIIVDKWELNSVGYDKESDFVYFSLSGQEYSYSSGTKGQANGKYLTNIRYVDLQPGLADDKRVSSDDYIQESPYTLSDVNFETYTDQNNIYLVKQTINGDSGQWLSTTTADLNDDAANFKTTGTINFNSLESFTNIIEESKILNNFMPSVVNENLSNLDLTGEEWGKYVKFINATGNDETGEIDLKTEITYANNFGDSETISNNGSVSYTSYIRVIGFLASNDFSLTFKNNTDSAVTEIKSKYSAEKIIESSSGKAFVINHLFENLIVNGQNFVLKADDITLKSGTSTNDLIIEVTVPIKTSLTDEKGILPVGFPIDKNTLIFNFNGFTGTEAPPIEQLPGFTGQGLSSGEIAGIIIGCLLLTIILLAAIALIWLRIKAKSVVNK